MGFVLKLPKGNSNEEVYDFENNSLIIIGANGSGKSRLGAWIETQDLESVHRVGAQKSLNFKDFIDLKSYTQSENLLFYGSEELRADKGYRWNWGNYSTHAVQDYDAVLSAIIAKRNLQNENYLSECKKRDNEGQSHEKVPETVLDQVYNIWNQIYPHRKIKIEDAQVLVEFNQINYKGSEMSDGERVALYLIAQCLAVPRNKTIIIDEPEVHLHRSIMNRLWKAIEEIRTDCLFIYITHDTNFAASHKHAKKVWVKEYDGQNWKWEFVDSNGNLPEQCLLDILGNRKNTIFVEGNHESYDTSIYREIYRNYHIVPCGSSLNVIEYTKAMNSNNQMHHLKAFGIIDRDFRDESEIKYLESQNIYVLEIAEVENLFCIEEVLRAINEHFAFSDSDRVEKAIDYIINQRFSNQISKQISKAVTAQIKYKISSYDVSGISIEEIQGKIDTLYEYIGFEALVSEIKQKYTDVLESKNYKETLKIFNEKGLSSTVGQYFGISNKEYCELILRLLKNKNTNISVGMQQYLPDFDSILVTI